MRGDQRRDKARAIQVYVRQAHNIEAERKAVQIRLRAEKKAGQLLKEREKAKGGRPPENQSNDTTGLPEPKTLADLGISKTQSSQWHQLADVPEKQFEAALAAPDKPTTTGIIATAKPTPPAEALSMSKANGSALVAEPAALRVDLEYAALKRYLANARKSVPDFPSPEVAGAMPRHHRDDLRNRAERLRAWAEKLLHLLDAADHQPACSAGVQERRRRDLLFA